jgi:hypothetical protein
MRMTDPKVTTTENASPLPTVPAAKVAMSDWAVAILLTLLVGLSAAALLGATFMELLFDKVSAWIRIIILLPVLLISSFLLVKKWQKLFHRHDAAKK